MSAVSQFLSGVSPAALFVTLNVNDTIQANDLVALGTDGNIYACADPTLGGVASASKPVFNASIAPFALASNVVLPQAAIAPASYQSVASALLTNGNTVIVINDNVNLYFTIYDDQANLIVPTTTIGVITSTYFAVGALTGGGFAVVWGGTSNYPYRAVYANDGTQTLAPATITTSNSLVDKRPHVAGLSGGGFAIFYTSSAISTYATTCNAAGTITAGPTAVGSAGGATVRSVAKRCIAPLTNGNFAVMWDDTNAGAYRYAVYGPTRSVVKTQTNVPAGTWGSSANSCWDICALSGGGFGIAWVDMGANVLYEAVFNAAGTVQGSSQSIQSGMYGPSGATAACPIACCGLNGGAMQVVWSYMTSGSAYSSLGIYVVQVTASGTVGTIVTVNTGSPGNLSVVAVAPTFDGGSILSYIPNSSNEVIAKVSSAGVVTSSFSTSATGGTDGFNAVWLVSNTTTGLVTRVHIKSSTTAINYMPIFANGLSSRAVIGVAQAAATAGQTCKVQVFGNATLRLTFKMVWKADFTSSTPVGQFLNVIGNLAQLGGLSGTALGRVQIN